MTRDNEKRSGAGSQPPESALSSLKEGESLKLSFPTPEEFVDIPSRGRFYSEGHALHNVEQIEIRHMTAREEDILTNGALIKKGVAIDRMLQNIVLSPKFKIEDMYAGDKNALTIAARITGFGPEYTTKVRCPACQEHNDHTFDLNEAKVESVDVLPENVVETQTGIFKISGLPKCDYDVEVRLMTGHDEHTLAISSEKKRKMNLPSTAITDQLKIVIVSVGGSKNSSDISQFVDSMHLLTVKKIKSLYRQLTPNVDLTQDFECSNCQHQEKMEVPFSTEFFWPKQ